jgi:hypothetical protein
MCLVIQRSASQRTLLQVLLEVLLLLLLVGVGAPLPFHGLYTQEKWGDGEVVGDGEGHNRGCSVARSAREAVIYRPQLGVRINVALKDCRADETTHEERSGFE